MNDQLDVATTAPPAGSFGFGTLFRGVRHHPFMALLAVVATLATAAAIWLFLPLPKMTAYVTFRILAQPQALFTPVGDAKAHFTYYRHAQAALVKTPPVLNTALNQPEAEVGLLKGLKGRDRIAWLENKLQVDFKTSPEFMRLSLEGDNEAEMLAIIKAIQVAYMKEVVYKHEAGRTAHFQQLENVQRDYQQTL